MYSGSRGLRLCRSCIPRTEFSGGLLCCGSRLLLLLSGVSPASGAAQVGHDKLAGRLQDCLLAVSSGWSATEAPVAAHLSIRMRSALGIEVQSLIVLVLLTRGEVHGRGIGLIVDRTRGVQGGHCVAMRRRLQTALFSIVLLRLVGQERHTRVGKRA